MERTVLFKRMVLGLPHSAQDYVAVAFTAELADVLGLDLVGVFAEDDRLVDLAVLPCVREFRFLTDGWHPVDAGELARVSMQAAAEARRLFADAAKALRVASRFDLVKGQIAEAIGAQSLPDDIIVVIEPRNPAERVTHQFRQLMAIALESPTAALIVPSRIRRRAGPIVAIATGEGDPSIAIAQALARSVRERLIVIGPAGEPLSGAPEGAEAVVIHRPSMRDRSLGLAEIGSLLARTGERLVVLSRKAGRGLPPQLASERGVPVLVTGEV